MTKLNLTFVLQGTNAEYYQNKKGKDKKSKPRGSGSSKVRKMLRKRIYYLFESQKGLCHYCQCECVRTLKAQYNQATLDHIIPKSRGGTNRVDNLVMACYRCNLNKGDKPYDEFVKSLSEVNKDE